MLLSEKWFAIRWSEQPAHGPAIEKLILAHFVLLARLKTAPMAPDAIDSNPLASVCNRGSRIVKPVEGRGKLTVIRIIAKFAANW